MTEGKIKQTTAVVAQTAWLGDTINLTLRESSIATGEFEEKHRQADQ